MDLEKLTVCRSRIQTLYDEWRFAETDIEEMQARERVFDFLGEILDEERS